MTQVDEKTTDDFKLARQLADDAENVSAWVRSQAELPPPVVGLALARLYYAAGIASAHLLTKHVAELASTEPMSPVPKPKFWAVANAIDDLERIVQSSAVTDPHNSFVKRAQAVIYEWRKVSP